MDRRWKEASALIARFAEAALLFTGDKESTVLLELKGDLQLPVLFPDTGLYAPEIYRYLEVAQDRWGFKATVLRDDRVIERSTVVGKTPCYLLLREQIVMPYLKEQGIGALIEPWREDSRAVIEGEIARVLPLVGFSDLEIWRFIRERGLPYCELYDRGLREVGCEPCSRSARGPEVDRAEIERRLRALGYL